jgi:hypothetical protein
LIEKILFLKSLYVYILEQNVSILGQNVDILYQNVNRGTAEQANLFLRIWRLQWNTFNIFHSLKSKRQPKKILQSRSAKSIWRTSKIENGGAQNFSGELLLVKN